MPGTPETAPEGDQPVFKPAVDVDALTKPDETAFNAMKPEAEEQFFPPVDVDHKQFFAHSAELQSSLAAEGYSRQEIKSLVGSGFVMPEISADQDPSQARLEHVAKQEAARQATATPEAIEQQKQAYAAERQRQIDHYTELDTYSPEQVDRIVSLGLLMPAEFSPTPAADLLRQRADHGETDLHQAA